MKKFLLSVLAGLSIGAAEAQTFDLQYGDTSRATYNSETVWKVANRVRSTSSNPVKLQWRYLAATSSIPSGWGFDGVCDNTLCRGLSAISGGAWFDTDSVDNTYLNTNGGGYLVADENDIHAQFSGMSAAPNGTAVVRVEMRDGAAPSYTRTLTLIGTKSTTGISTYRTDDAIVIYPNPASESINVLFDERAGVKNIAIYNLIGQPVSVFHVQGGSAKLSLGEAPAGVYFARLLDAQGQIVATRRFTRQ